MDTTSKSIYIDDSTVESTCSHSEVIDAVLGVEYDDNGAQQQAASNGQSQPNKKSGVFATCNNLINYILGAGIIGMPYAMKMSGLVAGTFLLILVAWMTDKSLRMLVDMANYHPKLRKLDVHTFEDLASFAFGSKGAYFILFSMMVISYGSLIAYCLIIKDTVHPVLGLEETEWQRKVVLVVTTLVTVLPLAMQRDMASLAFTSLISITADIVLIFFIVFSAPMKQSVSEAGGLGEVLKDEWFKPATSFIGLGVLSDAMACQHAAFLIGGSLANRTRARWAAVTYRSIFVVGTATGLIGICGYLGFMDATQGDILNNFDPDSLAANAARGLLAITMVLTYPMESFVVRHVLIKIMHNGDIDGGEGYAEAVENNALPGWKCFGRRQIWTLVIYVCSLVPALFLNDLGPVLSIVGSLGASCIAYIAPGLVFLGIHGDEFLAMITASLSSPQSKAVGDLPLDGDATAKMQSGLVSASYKEMSKPWWWYPLLMPVWCSIASTGSVTMRKKIAESSVDVGDTALQEVSSNVDVEDEPLPNRRDFCVAIWFILFGVVAVVLGLLSNFVAQVSTF